MRPLVAAVGDPGGVADGDLGAGLVPGAAVVPIAGQRTAGLDRVLRGEAVVGPFTGVLHRLEDAGLVDVTRVVLDTAHVRAAP